MVDFHSHVLPDMDDGADRVETSLAMFRESRAQGVKLLCATSHFYADEESPASFLARRQAAWDRLRKAMYPGESWPEIRLGAEILYFPGMSVADELSSLTLEGTVFLLVEPPMMTWSESMLEEIEECGARLHRIPVIAHVDRYMRMLGDGSLLDRVGRRRMLAQVNASFFLHRSCREQALKSLTAGKFQFIGSDCHDMAARRPNLGDAAKVASRSLGEEPLQKFSELARRAMSVG